MSYYPKPDSYTNKKIKAVSGLSNYVTKKY